MEKFSIKKFIKLTKGELYIVSCEEPMCFNFAVHSKVYIIENSPKIISFGIIDLVLDNKSILLFTGLKSIRFKNKIHVFLNFKIAADSLCFYLAYSKKGNIISGKNICFQKL